MKSLLLQLAIWIENTDPTLIIIAQSPDPNCCVLLVALFAITNVTVVVVVVVTVNVVVVVVNAAGFVVDNELPRNLSTLRGLVCRKQNHWLELHHSLDLNLLPVTRPTTTKT